MILKLSLALLSLLSHLESLDWADVESLDAVGLHDLDPEARAAVQIDLLADPDGAEALAASVRERLAAEGRALEVFVEAVPGDFELPPSYRVGVGPFADFEDAERAKIELEALGFDGFVRELDWVLAC